MALETAIASFHFPAGPLRGTQLSLFGTRLLHHGVDQMESITLAAVAAVRVAYERDIRRIAWGAALIVLAIVLFVVSGPLSTVAAEAAAGVSGNTSVAQLLRRIAWGAALIVLAIGLFIVSGPLSTVAAEAAAGVSGNTSVAQLLRGTLLVLGALASLLAAVGVACVIGGGAFVAFGWIGTTTLVLSLPAGERSYGMRGKNRLLVDFAELLAERVAQNGR